MTDEINEETFKKVDASDADIANEPKDFYLYAMGETLEVGELVRTKKDGFLKIVEGGTTDALFAVRIDEADVPKGTTATYLEVYGIEYR